MCADDIWNVIEFDKDTFDELIFEYTEFEDFVGLRVNYNKSEILRLGSLRHSDAKFITTLPLKWSDGPLKILGTLITPNYANMVKINFDLILLNVEGLLKSWETRGLTLIGKIQVINSLANSRIAYKLQCLPSPSEEFFDKYKSLVTQFLWNGKKPKIAYNRLILSLDQGGLQLRDLRMVNDSLKVANFKKIFLPDRPFWCNYFETLVPLTDVHLSLINMRAADVKRNFNPSIFADMCVAWAKINYWSPDSVLDIFHQSLWFNSHVHVNHKWLFNREMYHNGIVKIIDIFNLDTGRFYDFETFQDMYPAVRIDFLKYHAACKAIPACWRDTLLKNEPGHRNQKRIDWMERLCHPKFKASKLAFRKIRDSLPTRMDALTRIWNNDLHISMQASDLSKHFKRINYLTFCSKLRFFQFRLLNKVLTTNVTVSKWNSEISNKCFFCNSTAETTVHIFVECTHVKKIWKALCKWLSYFHEIRITLSPQNIIFCNVSKRSARLINHVVLIAKFYIYRMRSTQGKLKFIDL